MKGQYAIFVNNSNCDPVSHHLGHTATHAKNRRDFAPPCQLSPLLWRYLNALQTILSARKTRVP